MLLKVDTLNTAQSGITGQLSALQSQVDKANLLAEAMAVSTTIQDLIAGMPLAWAHCALMIRVDRGELPTCCAVPL